MVRATSFPNRDFGCLALGKVSGSALCFSLFVRRLPAHEFPRYRFTPSGGFTGNYLEDDPTGYVALGIYRSF
jgi:hypothetical protein